MKLLLLWIALLPPALAQNQDTAEKSEKPSAEKKEFAAKVRQLINQLDADERADRYKAQEELIKLGPSVLDYLEPASGELGERIASIIDVLSEKLSAENTKPTTVTLKGEFSITEILGEITKQTGNEFIGSENRDKKITVDFEKTEFWRAVDEVLDEGQLSINNFRGEGRALSLMPADENAPNRLNNAAYVGVHRISLSRMTLSKNLENPALNAFRITMRVFWEPRLNPISLAMPLADVSIKDGSDNEISVANPERRLASNIPKEPSIEITVPLNLPDGATKKIKSFKGKFNIVVPGRTEEFRFKNLGSERVQSQRRGGVKVTLEKVEKKVDLHHVKVKVRFEKAGQALASYRSWIYSNEAFLKQSDGTLLEMLHFEPYSENEELGEVGFNYLFDVTKLDKEMQLVYKTPSAILNLPVEFELKDIDLP